MSKGVRDGETGHLETRRQKVSPKLAKSLFVPASKVSDSNTATRGHPAAQKNRGLEERRDRDEEESCGILHSFLEDLCGAPVGGRATNRASGLLQTLVHRPPHNIS